MVEIEVDPEDVYKPITHVIIFHNDDRPQSFNLPDDDTVLQRHLYKLIRSSERVGKPDIYKGVVIAQDVLKRASGNDPEPSKHAFMCARQILFAISELNPRIMPIFSKLEIIKTEAFPVVTVTCHVTIDTLLWTCPTCTYKNIFDDEMCMACETIRPKVSEVFFTAPDMGINMHSYDYLQTKDANDFKEVLKISGLAEPQVTQVIRAIISLNDLDEKQFSVRIRQSRSQPTKIRAVVSIHSSKR